MPSRRFVPARLPEATPPNLPSPRSAAVLPDHDPEDEARFRGLDYVDLDLTGRVAGSVEFDGCAFKGSDLGDCVLDKGAFVDCRFETCNLANVRASDASLRRVQVSVSRMTGFQWINGVLRDVAFRDCRLDLSTFRFSKLTDVVFTDCNLVRADFTNADLTRARFVNCVVAGAQFSHANLTGTRFTRCELVDIDGVTSMRGAVLEGHNLIALAHTLATGLGITLEDDDADSAG
jgi:uncharacterized protein YjbI with pentapeptide repeats